jgi:hypothetical protein
VTYTDPSGYGGLGPSEAGEVIVWCFGVAFIVPDIGPTELICTLIAAGVITVMIVPVAMSNPQQAAAQLEILAENAANACENAWTQITQENVYTVGKSGGAKEAAHHLAMLLGVPVAGFYPHPGKPDPDGRDRKHNILGLLSILEELARNVKDSGKDLISFLSSQGWTIDQIDDFVLQLNNFTENVLPFEKGITPDVILRFNTVVNRLLGGH